MPTQLEALATQIQNLLTAEGDWKKAIAAKDAHIAALTKQVTDAGLVAAAAADAALAPAVAQITEIATNEEAEAQAALASEVIAPVIPAA